jgi:hypothetical protein
MKTPQTLLIRPTVLLALVRESNAGRFIAKTSVRPNRPIATGP